MNPKTAEMLTIVERAFPYVTRPSEAEIPFHRDACGHCEMTVQHLRKYPDEQLPFPAIRWLCDELSALSARAFAWVLPAYLRFVLSGADADDPRPTEFLIYTLSPAPEFAEETGARLALLDVNQLEALSAIVDYWRDDRHWNEYCGEELEQAATFLGRLLASRRPRR